MNEKKKFLTPALCSAVSLIGATLVAVATMGRSAPLQLIGPLLFTACILGTDVLAARAQGRTRAPSGAALFMALTFLVAMLILVLRSPDLVTVMLPILASCMTTTTLTMSAKPSDKSSEACP